METKDYKNENSDPVIDLGLYIPNENKKTVKQPSNNFSINTFWAQLSPKNQLYIGIALTVVVVLIISIISFSGSKDHKKSVTPDQYSTPANYPTDSKDSYKLPLP